MKDSSVQRTPWFNSKIIGLLMIAGFIIGAHNRSSGAAATLVDKGGPEQTVPVFNLPEGERFVQMVPDMKYSNHLFITEPRTDQTPRRLTLSVYHYDSTRDIYVFLPERYIQEH